MGHFQAKQDRMRRVYGLRQRLDQLRLRFIYLLACLHAEDTGDDECNCVVQASGNWQARLAAAFISVVKGYDTLILPRENACCACPDSGLQNIQGLAFRSQWRRSRRVITA